MKYLKIFEDFERSAYTKISSKILSRGNDYIKELCPFLNIDLYEDVDVIPGGNFLYNDTTYDSIETLIEEVHDVYINAWDYRQSNFTINNGLLDIEDDVILYGRNLTRIPYKFGEVTGFFNCRGNKLTSLKGAPHKVGGYFTCKNNYLTTLEGAPHIVGDYFDCSNNQLTTLEGGPYTVGTNPQYKYDRVDGPSYEIVVGRDFWCDSNQLTNLKHLPEKVGGRIYCGNNPNLTDFSDVPEEWEKKLIK